MSSESGLERRYRQLMGWYPATHRHQHEEEMLGVLMSGARSGQRRPGLAESANLIWGALRIRLRPGLDSAADPGWRDALAVVSVILPLYFLFFIGGSYVTAVLQPGTGMFSLRDLAMVPGVPLVLTVLVLLRLRRTAALATAALAIGLTAFVVNWWAHDFGSATLEYAPILVFAPALETVALLASPGPRRGFAILSWKHWILIPVTALAMFTAAQSSASETALVVLAVIAVAMTVASALGRRILVLLAIPFSSFAIAMIPGLQLLPVASGITLTYLPPLAIIALAVALAHRSRRARTP